MRVMNWQRRSQVAAGWLAALLLLLTPLMAGARENAAPAVTPKFIFLFIGDGMGGTQRRAAEIALGRQLPMNHLPVAGTTTTHNVDGKVTDSAASGTALACGVKTKNGMLGMDPDGQPLDSIAVKAKRAGLKVGILSSVPLDDATPAAFYARSRTRSSYLDITRQLPQSGFDFFGGGGLRSAPHNKPEAWEIVRAGGYTVIDKPQSLAGKYEGPTFINSYVPRAIDARGRQTISLAQITAAAIRSLDNEDGFFMMVEGGAIDWACHHNDGANAIGETEAFDLAVQEALRFSAERPGACLIVVTADHETGGMTITDESKLPAILSQTRSEPEFHLTVAELTKKGAPSSEFLAAAKDFFGCQDFSEAEEQSIRQSWEDHLARGEKAKNMTPSREVLRLFNRRCGISWTTGGHTGQPVLTTASGAGAQAFAGHYDNTDIALRIEALLPAAAQPDQPVAAE